MSYRSDMQKIKKAELFNMKSEEIMGVKGFIYELRVYKHFMEAQLL